MNSITQKKRYCPHEITTKINSAKLYRETRDISFVCRRYHISKASLMRRQKYKQHLLLAEDCRTSRDRSVLPQKNKKLHAEHGEIQKKIRVNDGSRTHDLQGHNLAL